VPAYYHWLIDTLLEVQAVPAGRVPAAAPGGRLLRTARRWVA